MRSPSVVITMAVSLAVLGCVQSRAGDPVFLGRYPASGSTPSLFYGVGLSGGETFAVTYGYGASDGNGALRVLAGTSPPVQVRSTAKIDGLRKLEIGGQVYALWAYDAAGNWRSGVRIFDKDTLAEFDTDDRLFWVTTRARGIDVEGTTLYVAGDDGLIVEDVTDPDVEAGVPGSGPQFLGVFPGVTTGYDVDVVAGLAFVADGTAGLRILDVTNPASMSQLAVWPPGAGETVRGVHVAEGVGGQVVAYVVGSGFWTVDVSLPNAPVELGELDEEADRVVAAGGFAYVAGEFGLRVYDVGDLGNPVLEGRYITPNRAEDVAYAAPFIHLADRSGLIVLRHGAAPAIELTLAADPAIGSPPLDVSFTTDLTGGTPPYVFDWFIDQQLVSSGEESYHSHTFDSAELHVVRVTVTDASGKVASAAVEVDVRGPKARLYGVVGTADTGEHIGNASLVVQGPGGVLVAADTVNPAGQYSFGNLDTEIYRVTATAPEYQPQTKVVAMRRGQNRELNFELSGLLDEEARKKKIGLIAELSRFPEDARDWEVGDAIGWLAPGGGPAGPALNHPYARAEQLTALWVAEQTELSEGFQRLTLAEGAFKTMSDDAVIYANHAGEYGASAMGNTLDLVISLFQLESYIEKKLWFADVHRGLTAKLAQQYSFRMFVQIAEVMGERSTLVARRIYEHAVKNALRELATREGVDVNGFVFDWKRRFANYWAQALIDEYGRVSEPLLTTALDRTIAGAPYALDYGDSKAIVLNELRATAAKRESVARAQGNIDIVSDEIFGRGGRLFSFLHGILKYCEDAGVEEGLAHLTELAFRSSQVYAEGGNAQLALDRLQVGLPQEAANAVYWAFGETPPVFPPAAGAGLPEMAPWIPADGAPGRGPEPLSPSAPTSEPARTTLTTAHGQLAAGDLASYSTTLLSGVAVEMDGYLHDAQVAETALGFRLAPEAPELEEAAAQLGWCRDSYEYLLAGSLQLLMHAAAGNPPGDPAAVALREKLLNQIASLISILGSADHAISAADLAAQELPDPGPALAITLLTAADAEGRALLPSVAGGTLEVTAEVVNVGSGSAAGVQISLGLATTSQLSVSGSPLTLPLPALAAGASTTVTWTLNSAVPGYQRFEWLTAELAHSGGDHMTRLPAGRSMLIVPGLYYPDADGDGISDDFEDRNGLDPGNTADGGSDMDGDTLSALLEFLSHTNPNSVDTDGDGCPDPDELEEGTSPFGPASHPVPTPTDDQLELAVFDAAGEDALLLRARFLKPDPVVPLIVQSSENLVDWDDLLVYSGGVSGSDPAVLQHDEYEGHHELLLVAPDLLPAAPPSAFYRIYRPDPPPATVRLTTNPGDDLRPNWHPTWQQIVFVTYRQPYPNDPNLGYVEATGANEHLMASGVTEGSNGLAHSVCWGGDMRIGGDSVWRMGVYVEERVSRHEYLLYNVNFGYYRLTWPDYGEGAFALKLKVDNGGSSGGFHSSRDRSTFAWRYSTQPDGTGSISLRSGPALGTSMAGQYTSAYGSPFLARNSSSGELLDRGFALNANGTVAVVSLLSGSGRDLFLCNTNGTGSPLRVTNSGVTAGAFNEWPEFSPDGLQIAFTYRGSAADSPDIAVIRTDGSGFENVTRSADWSEMHPTYSPNGARLAFQRYDDASTGALSAGESPNWNIHVINIP